MKALFKTITPGAALLFAGTVALAQQPAAAQPTAQERVAALKASFASSAAILRQYEWIETTTMFVKGEQKSQQQNRCYYGADGTVQKVPVAAPPPAKEKGGLRGKIAASKKEEMSEYMKEAVGLVKRYLPPDPAKIQAVKDAGKLAVAPLPDQKVRLTFSDYVKAGDALALEMSLANNSLLSAKVATTMDSDKAPVTLAVQFAVVDKATYAAQTVLDATGKELKVTIANSGYRKQAP